MFDASQPMHPVFSLVPRSSFEAYVRSESPSLDEVLCALIVDPQKARKAYAKNGIAGTPHSLYDFQESGESAFRSALETIAQWVTIQPDAETAVRSITEYSHRLGVWCALSLARDALRVIAPKEKRPAKSLEVVRSWIAGKANFVQLENASEDASSFANLADARGEPATSEIATAVRHVAIAAADPGDQNDSPQEAAHAVLLVAKAYVFHDRVAEDHPTFSPKVATELSRLRGSVAKSCLSFAL